MSPSLEVVRPARQLHASLRRRARLRCPISTTARARCLDKNYAPPLRRRRIRICLETIRESPTRAVQTECQLNAGSAIVRATAEHFLAFCARSANRMPLCGACHRLSREVIYERLDAAEHDNLRACSTWRLGQRSRKRLPRVCARARTCLGHARARDAKSRDSREWRTASKRDRLASASATRAGALESSGGAGLRVRLPCEKSRMKKKKRGTVRRSSQSRLFPRVCAPRSEDRRAATRPSRLRHVQVARKRSLDEKHRPGITRGL